MIKKYIHIFNNGLNCYRNGNYSLSIKYYLKVINKYPKHDIVLFNYALVLFQLKKFKKAIKFYKKSFKISKNNEILINIGDAYMQLNKYDKAINYYKKVLQDKPSNKYALINLGLAYKRLGKYHLALKYYNDALAINTDSVDAHWNIGNLQLLLGNYEVGFEEYEYRLLLPFSNIRKLLYEYNFPLWNGEDLKSKKLLIHPDQGFGDNIQFIRYVYLLHEAGVTVYTRPIKSQKELFSSIKNLNIISTAEELINIDYFILSTSLPYLCKTTLITIPNKIPYLFSTKKQWKKELFIKSKKIKVGLFWQGERNHANDKNRSIKFKYIDKLLKIKNIDFYSLQIDSEKNRCKKYKNLIDCSPYINDFADTASIINNLDLVITVDSAIAHLSGALGMQTWLLLPVHPDWRWLLNRDDSPWYSTVKLLRQNKYNTWGSVLEEVSKQLRAITSTH